MSIGLLQINPLMKQVEQALSERYAVRRFWEMEGRDSLTNEDVQEIRAIVAGGEFGADTDWMRRLPNLEIVSINGVGLDQVDLDTAKERGIRVTIAANVLTDDVADLGIGMAISLLRQLNPSEAYLRAGQWPSGSFQLANKFSRKKSGIVGLGQIGRALAKRLEGFTDDILYTDIAEFDVPYTHVDNLISLAEQSEILFITAAATPENIGMINGDVFRALGRKGVIVNVSRGSLVDEPALISALDTGEISGAALDVFAEEPHVPQKLIDMPNVLLTPHIASGTIETRLAMGQMVLDNLEAHFAGNELISAVI